MGLQSYDTIARLPKRIDTDAGEGIFHRVDAAYRDVPGDAKVQTEDEIPL